MENTFHPSITFDIRILTPDDAPLYFDLRLEALTLEPFAFLAYPETYRQRSLESLASQLASQEQGNFTLGAFLDGRLVGMATFILMAPEKFQHKGEVVSVYVRPEARGKGLARTLMETLIERVRSYPRIEQVLLSVASTQTAAQGLYESLGFQQFGLEPRSVKVGDQYADLQHRILHLK